MTIEIVPLSDDWLEPAAALLAQQHQRNREAQPLLPGRFAAPDVARRAIEAVRGRAHARGWCALDGGRLVAYLVGDMELAPIWGRAGWVRLAGCAYDAAYGAEPVRDLYAVLGDHWLHQGVYFHFALAPIADASLVHAWFSLSFGVEQIHALMDLETLPAMLPPLPQGVEIRRIDAGDRDALGALSDLIWRHQTTAPVWAIKLPEQVEESRRGWSELVDDQEATVWVATVNGVVMGMQGYWPAEPSDDDMAIPDLCIELSVAATRPEARGRGIATLPDPYRIAPCACQRLRRVRNGLA